jgi:cell division protein FtsQ
VPVAFVRVANQIGLVDRNGVLLDMPPAMMAAKRYSFPVVTGVIARQNAEDRASRMRLYAEFMSALSSTDATAALQISEVDLSDPEDVRVLLPSASSDLLVHFGSEDFAARWERLEQKLPAWRQQYPRLAGVDLRYQRQTVLEMSKAADEGTAAADVSSTTAQAAAKPATKSVAKPLWSNRSAIQRAKPVPAPKKIIHKWVHRADTHGDDQ